MNQETIDAVAGGAADEARLRYEGWRVVMASGVGVFFATLVFYSFAVLLKPLIEEFGWTRQAVSIAYGGMTLAAALSAPFVGHLFDRLGPRRICGPCLLICGCAFASLALLTSHTWHLYTVFVLIGLATTGTSAVVYSRVVSSWFDERRGAALAVVMASAAVGGIVHPPLAQTLIRLAGWRLACLALGVIIVALGVPAIASFVRERASNSSHASRPNSGVTVREAVHSRAFWILIIVVFGSTLTINAAIVHLSALLTDRGLDASRAAMVISAMGAASLVGRLLTGWLLDRFTAPRVSFVLLTIAAFGTFLLADARTFPVGLIAALLIGFGTGGEVDVVPYLLSRYFGLRSLSTLYGLNWTAWGLAGAAGPVLMGRVFDATGSYEPALVAFAAATFAVATLMLALPTYGRSNVPTVAVR
jgi:MFS family permease